MHAKKAHFRNETRLHDAIVNHGGRSPIFKADGRSYKSGRKFIWVPVKPTGDKVDCAIMNLPETRSNRSNTDHGMKSGDQKIADDDSGVQQQQRGIDVLQKEPTLKPSLQVGNGKKVYTRDGLVDGCRNSIAAQSTSVHGDLKPNMGTHLEKPYVRTSTSKPADVSVNQYMRGKRNFETGGPSDRRAIFSAGEFASMISVPQYRPRKFESSRIMSVAPGTKPAS
jgi:hypothetical protein